MISDLFQFRASIRAGGASATRSGHGADRRRALAAEESSRENPAAGGADGASADRRSLRARAARPAATAERGGWDIVGRGAFTIAACTIPTCGEDE